jgi:hypothetical protein
VQGEDFGGGIVHGAQEHQRWGGFAEPGERAAVDLHPAAAGGFGDAAAAGPGWAPGTRRGAAESAPQPADGFATDGEPMLLGQLLGQVRVVEAHVDGGHEADDLIQEAGRQPARRGPAAAAMQQGGRAALLKAPFEAPHLPDTQAQRLGHLSIRNPSATNSFYQSRSLQFFSAQRESPHGGRTFSRCSYPRTFSCSTSTVWAPP